MASQKETVESVEPVVEPVVEPKSTDVLANAMAVLDVAFESKEAAQEAVNCPNCSYFQIKEADYNSLELRQVDGLWKWMKM